MATATWAAAALWCATTKVSTTSATWSECAGGARCCASWGAWKCTFVSYCSRRGGLRGGIPCYSSACAALAQCSAACSVGLHTLLCLLRLLLCRNFLPGAGLAYWRCSRSARSSVFEIAVPIVVAVEAWIAVVATIVTVNVPFIGILPVVASGISSVVTSVVARIVEVPASVVSEITSVEAVSHSEPALSWAWTKWAPMIPTVSAVHSPTVCPIVCCIETWATEIEICSIWIACVYAEPPDSVGPCKRAIEVCRSAESVVLPVEENIAQVQISSCPICAV